MKRNVVLICILALLVTGCIWNVEKQINISWYHVPTSEVQALSDGGEDIRMGENRYYSYTPNPSESARVHIEADLNGDDTKEFEFISTSLNPIKKIANNKAELTPLVAEKGTVLVRTEGAEKLIEYEVFNSASFGQSIVEPHIPKGFKFSTGERVDGRSDIYYQNMRAHANVVIIKYEPHEFWDRFVELNNLHELEYEFKDFDITLDNHMYIIKCSDGYAVLNPLSSSKIGASFIYKFSETGVFE